MKKYKNLYKIVLYICAIGLITSCVKHKENQTEGDNNNGNLIGDFVILNVNESQENFSSLSNQLSIKDMIVLKESEDIMFADLDKIIENQGMYYVLDSFGAKTLVSFDSEGNAYAKYGKIGKGPGEYVRPWDFDIYNSQVYILDSNAKKILRFASNGDFIDEKQIPFPAKGFKILKDGKMMFSLLPSGDCGPRLCLSDSTLSDHKYLLDTEKGYMGGFHTNNIFRNNNNGIIYYEAPQDTLFCFNDNGELTGGIVFDFGNRQVPHDAKLDYLQALENGLLEDKLRLNESPLFLDNGIIIGTISDDKSQYILLADISENVSGLIKCDPSKSVFDIIEPVTVDSNGNLICYTCREFIDLSKNKDALDEKLKSDLDDNEYVLLIYSQKKNEIND